MKLLHGNCFYVCVESVEQEGGIWKIFFRLFLSRLILLQSQVDVQWIGLDVACGSREAGRFPGPLLCLAQQAVDVLVAQSSGTALALFWVPVSSFPSGLTTSTFSCSEMRPRICG